MVLSLDPYQERGADWLAFGPDVLYLADQMRVGKTPQCVVACHRAKARRVLVVCPAIVRGGWLSEFRNFCPDQGFAENAVLVYSTPDIEKIEESTRLVVVSYDLTIRSDVFGALFAACMAYSFDVLILDEAHYLIHKEAKRTRFLLGSKCTGNEAIAGLVGKVWFVSGTPMKNDPSDLFPFMRMAGLWTKSRTDLINQFCFGFHDGYEFKITGSKNLPKLKAILAPRTLRRLRSDVSEVKVAIGTITLEPREYAPLKSTLDILWQQEPAYAKKLQEAIDRDDLNSIDIKHVAVIRRIIGLAKVDGLVELIKGDLDADPGCKVAVFGIHRDPLRRVRDKLRSYKASLLFGGSAPEARDRMLEAFATNHKNRVFIANLVAAGMGIDLSAADKAYIFEPSWTPVENAQALSRIIKIREPDKLKDVLFVGLAGTIDDAVTRICERKTRDIEALYSAV